MPTFPDSFQVNHRFNNEYDYDSDLYQSEAVRNTTPLLPPPEQSHLARVGGTIRGAVQSAYQDGRESVAYIREIMKPFEVPEDFLSALPRDIEVLRNMANRQRRNMPEMIDQFLASQGYAGFSVPCQAWGDVVARASAWSQLHRRIEAVENPRGAANASVMELAGQVAGRSYQVIMLTSALQNIHNIGLIMMHRDKSEAMATVLQIVRQALALFMHQHIFRNISADYRLLSSIESTNSLELPAWDLNNLEASFQAKIGALKARNETVRNLFLSDIPAFLLSFVTLVMADSMLKSARE